MAFRLMFSRGAVSAVRFPHKMFSRFNLDSNCRGTAFPKHGTAMQWEVGVIKLTATGRQFSPISLNRGRKQAMSPDPLWDEGHYRIGFCRPSQDIENQDFCPASKKPIAQPNQNASCRE